jgi:hypothetical protein
MDPPPGLLLPQPDVDPPLPCCVASPEKWQIASAAIDLSCRHQISLADFSLPFGGKLSRENRWIKMAELIPWVELEDYYDAQFCMGFGAPAKP